MYLILSILLVEFGEAMSKFVFKISVEKSIFLISDMEIYFWLSSFFVVQVDWQTLLYLTVINADK